MTKLERELLILLADVLGDLMSKNGFAPAATDIRDLMDAVALEASSAQKETAP